MVDTYARAYTELLEILKYLPKEEYNKIPKEKIEFYEKNKDVNYDYIYDISKSLNEQKISRKTNALILLLYKEYFSTPEINQKIDSILKQNEEKHQAEIREKYNPDNLFNNNINIQNSENNNSENMMIVPEQENIIRRIISWIKKFINR